MNRIIGKAGQRRGLSRYNRFDFGYAVGARRIGWRDLRLAGVGADPMPLELALERETDPAALAAQLPANRWFGLLLARMPDPAQREELVRQCTALYDKFVGFVTDLEDIGKRLKAAQSSYDDAYGKLASGKGNLVRQVERIRELGLKPAKLLPDHLTEVSVEDEAAAQKSLPH